MADMQTLRKNIYAFNPSKEELTYIFDAYISQEEYERETSENLDNYYICVLAEKRKDTTTLNKYFDLLTTESQRSFERTFSH